MTYADWMQDGEIIGTPAQPESDLVAVLVEALQDVKHLAETRITDGDEMGARIWRIALVDILASARAALAAAEARK